MNSRSPWVIAWVLLERLSRKQLRKKVITVISNKHVLAKTSTHLRQSIKRLQAACTINPNDPYVENYEAMILKLKEARSFIPKEYRDVDVKGD